MNKLIKIAVDAMGGDNAPNKIIDGIELHNRNSKNIYISFHFFIYSYVSISYFSN